MNRTDIMNALIREGMDDFSSRFGYVEAEVAKHYQLNFAIQYAALAFKVECFLKNTAEDSVSVKPHSK